jgi:hypothetical protein
MSKSDKIRASWQDPEVRRKRSEGVSRAFKGRTVSAEHRRKISESLKGRKKPREVVERQVETHRQRFLAGAYEETRQKTHAPPSDDTRAKIATALKGRQRPLDVSAKVSKGVSERWKDPEYRERVLSARRTTPNQLEQRLAEELAQLGFIFVGDGSFWVHDKAGSRNPDFRRPGSHLLVEIWGDYWHRGEVPEDLVRWYEAHDFQCLVIWESQLKSSIATELVSNWLGALGGAKLVHLGAQVQGQVADGLVGCCAFAVDKPVDEHAVVR